MGGLSAWSGDAAGQIAIENGILLLHNDRDFNIIANVIPELQLHPAD